MEITAGIVGGESARVVPSLSIFFPCYNDASTIAALVAAADEVARGATDDYEVIVVDDGSVDGSRALLVDLATHYPRMRVVMHGRNQGYGAALRSGMRAATKEFVFYTDGDGQYDVFELRKLLPVMQDGVDVVNGYKIARSDPWYRVIIGAIYRDLMRTLFRFNVRDIDCDFRLMRRSALDAIALQHTSGVICIELVKKLERAGHRFVDFPVHHYRRPHGRSQFFKPGRLLRTGVGVVALWWRLMARGESGRRADGQRLGSIPTGAIASD